MEPSADVVSRKQEAGGGGGGGGGVVSGNICNGSKEEPMGESVRRGGHQMETRQYTSTEERLNGYGA